MPRPKKKLTDLEVSVAEEARKILSADNGAVAKQLAAKLVEDALNGDKMQTTTLIRLIEGFVRDRGAAGAAREQKPVVIVLRPGESAPRHLMLTDGEAG